MATLIIKPVVTEYYQYLLEGLPRRPLNQLTTKPEGTGVLSILRTLLLGPLCHLIQHHPLGHKFNRNKNFNGNYNEKYLNVFADRHHTSFVKTVLLTWEIFKPGCLFSMCNAFEVVPLFVFTERINSF